MSSISQLQTALSGGADKLPLAGGTMDDGADIIFHNGSKLREGTTDAGLGGNKGIAQVCSIDYELKWEAGRLYVMGQDGFTIRVEQYGFSAVPTATDDATKGYVVGSRRILDNGDAYTCTDSTTDAAVWSLEVATETDPAVGAISGLIKSDGSGNISAAVAGTDYVATETDPVVLAITGLVKSDGSTISAAVSGTDYLAPTGDGTGLTWDINNPLLSLRANLDNYYVATETDPVVGAISGLIKSDGSGNISAAVAGTDYIATETDPVVLAITGLVKSDGSTISAAVAGTDYLTPTTTVALSAYDLDWTVGEVFSITLIENTTFTFSNIIDGKTIVVAVTNTGDNWTATWPWILWSGGTPPVLTVGAHTDVFTFINIGNTIYGSVVQNF